MQGFQNPREGLIIICLVKVVYISNAHPILSAIDSSGRTHFQCWKDQSIVGSILKATLIDLTGCFLTNSDVCKGGAY